MRWAIVALTTLSFISTSRAETPHLEFVTTYIHQLQNLERLRATAAAELQDDNLASKMSGCIRNGTRFELELRSQISTLKRMQLNPPFDELLPSLADFNERKIELYQKMSAACEAFMSGMTSGPKPGVDYDAIGAEMPKLTAELDYIDHAIFEATPLVFGMLISPVPDKNNHMSNLIITTAERKRLIDDINSYFGAKLQQEQQPWLVCAATVLRDYLLKDFNPSDAQQRPKK
jgi:hypothetical protein